MPEKLKDNGSPEYTYPGTNNLILIEKALARYNEWVVDKFIKIFNQQRARGTRVLDFGSGIGTLSKIFYKKTGVRPDAFDIDASHRDEMIKEGFRAYASLSDLYEGYNLIYTSNVLEHIEDDLGTLKSIRPYLHNNGVLLIYVPAFEFLWTSMDDMVGHVRRYTRDELCNKLNSAGYEIKSARYCDAVGFILSLFFKCVRRKDGHMPLASLHFYDRFLLPLNKILDVMFSRCFGKNLYIVAHKSM